jgi:hypothetical protein
MKRMFIHKSNPVRAHKSRRATAMRPLLVMLCFALFAAAVVALPTASRKVRAQNSQDKSKPIPTVQSVTPAATAPDEDEEGDADLPPRLRGKIDKEDYLRLRDEHFNALRGIDLNDGKSFDPNWRASAVRQMEQQMRMNAPDVSGTTWTEIGPFSLPNGQTQQFPATTPVNGRATAIVVDPTSSNKVYLGTAQGGVWRSTNGGTTWTAIFDTAQSLAIGALALAPSNPTILYVGTGEPNNSADSFFGVGVYRIDNADTTANLVGPINPSITTGTTTALTYNCFNGRAISKIVVSESDPATIFVSTAAGVAGAGGNALSNTVPPLALRGVFRSTNATAAAGSVTFSKLIVNTDGSLDVPGTGNTSIFDMVLEPGNSNNLLVSTSGTTTGGVIMRSTNALGATPTFTQVLFPGFNGLVMKLAINKVGAVVTVYCSTNEPSGVAACSSISQAGRLRKSTDAGVTWSTPLTAAEGYCGGQCVYDNPIGVDPNNASIVYIGGNARGTCSDVLKKSTDGGATFTRDDTGLHADSHGFAFDPLTTPTTVWFVTDGGVWKRPDAPAGTPWLSQNQGTLGTIQFVSLAVHPTDQFFTIGGTQDNGTEAQTVSSGNWVAAESGDGGFALIDQSATNTTNVTMYHTFFNLANQLIGFDRTNLGTCLAVKDSWEFRGAGGGVDATPSCDGTAFAATNGLTISDTVLFYAPMALGPGTPNTFYFGTNKLYRSTDRGDTMTIVSQNPLIAGVAISAIGISPSNDGVRIVGMRNGNVFATTTGSTTPTNTAFPFPTNATASTTNRHVSRAVIDPLNSNTAYVTLAYYTNPATAGQIWRTTNLNSATPTWTSIGNSATGLPNIPVNGFAVDANDPTHPGVSVLYAGADIGVYRSTDSGATWTPFGTGLPNTSVFDMAIQPTSRILRVATHGRGMWEIALPGSPTAAKLSSFTATTTDDGRVLLQWRTGVEVDNLGFNVYRDADGVRTRITPQLVAGSALLASRGVKLTSGNAYAWLDTPPAGKTIRYLLEDLDLNGKSAWNGPIAISGSVGKGSAAAQQQAMLLTRLGARQSQLNLGLGSVPVERSAKLAATGGGAFPLANSAAVKLSVNREGWYRITQPELVAAGLDPKVNPRFLQLFVDGREVPITVQGGQNGAFNPADSLSFYGVGLDAASSNTRVYWLAAGSQPGLRIEKLQTKGLASTAPSFAYTMERKDRTIYFPGLRNGDAENFFGSVIAREPVDQSLTLQRVNKAAATPAQLEITLQGVTQQTHQVKVLLNGADVGSVNFGGQARGVASLPIQHSLLVEGENVVRLIAQAGETDVCLVDTLRITYQHTYTAESNALRLPVTAGQQITIDGFTSSDIQVFDVTNPDALQEVATTVKAQKGGYAVTAAAPAGGQRTLLALTGARARQVLSARANQPSNWRQPANGANLLIITHRDFAASTASLKSLRQSQGLSVAVIDIEDIFDEFSYGQKTPQAMKDFLAYAKGSWKKPPQYAVLVGDSSYDPKNNLGFGDTDYVPTRLIDTQYLETASDDWLADFDGDGIGDLALGRLPVRTAQEAVTVINKIVAYDSTPGSESVLLVADRNEGFNFESSNTLLRSLIPTDLKVEEVDRNNLDDATARQQLLAAINRGQKVVNYTGHGSLDNWNGQALTNDDALGLTNTRLSLFIMMTCLNGYYHDPALESLAASLMKASRGGAFAVWASSGMTSPGNQLGLNQQMVRSIFDTSLNLSLGEATLRAKAAVNDSDIRRTWILFGDPSARLR